MTLVPPEWVLRSARRYCGDPAWRTAAAFADGGAAAPAVHRSQVSRWENGSTPPSYDLVRRYEAVCGYRDGQLVTALDVMARAERPVSATSFLHRPMPADPVATAVAGLETAVSQEAMTGGDWDRLTALLGDLPVVVLLPDQWRTLLRRGMREMSISVGLPYLQRLESMARLAGHPSAAKYVVRLVEEVLTDPASQIYSEVTALLQFSDDPAAMSVLLRAAQDPVNTDALWSAMFAAAAKLRRKQVDPEAAVEIAQVALRCCRDQSLPYRTRRSAADVLVALTPDARRRIAAGLVQEENDLAIASIVTGDGPLPAERLSGLRSRVARHVEKRLGTSLEEEPHLLHLLDFITVETNDERRADALEMLMLLPLGAAVGAAYVEELHRALRRNDEAVVHEAMSVLSFLPPSDQAPMLLDLATRTPSANGGAEHVAAEAAFVLGNCRDLDDHETEEVVRRVGDAVRAVLTGPDQPPPERLLRGWAYALGMHGARDRMPAATGAGPALEAWEAARQWWLDLPDYLVRAATER